MTMPEQLQLDFSAPAAPTPSPTGAPTPQHHVYSFARYRAERETVRLASAYEAILKSVEHIRPRRVAKDAEADPL